jgi:hypothetical protein
MYVTDLRHFLDLPDDAPAPARRLGEHLSLIVRAATAGDTGVQWRTALRCGRRPGHQPCPGHMSVSRTDVPPSIRWWCTACADEGVISGWEQSPFDLRSPTHTDATTANIRAVIAADVAVTLQSILFLDLDVERLVFQASSSPEGVILTGDPDLLGELVDSVAAEANHEDNRRRQRQLDAALDVLEAILNQE